MAILNLTQHQATPEQIAAGVVDLPAKERDRLVSLLTFDTLPTPTEVVGRAERICSGFDVENDGFVGHDTAMIGGAPFLMASLEDALYQRGIKAVYAFSRRESVDQPQADGSVRKVAVFRHAGFVPAVLSVF